MSNHNKDKDSIGFSIFSLDDPQAYRFYAEQSPENPVYYAIYIEEITHDFPAMTREVMHLHDEAVLLIDSYIVPVFLRIGLRGYMIAVSREFCPSNEIYALMRLTFFHQGPEGITYMGPIDDVQRMCIEMIYEEYLAPFDERQHSVLLNLAVNLALLSPARDFERQIKSGHMLNYAIQFIEMLDKHVFHERRKSFYAERMGITEKMLADSLQFIFNRTFSEIVVHRLLVEAMRMLVFSPQSINGIARELDCDPSDFNRMFKRHKNMSPKELRTVYCKIIDQL